VTLYLDTSSLVKLYVAEKGSDVVRQLAKKATVVSTSLMAYAEMRAALARLRREHQLTAAQFASAKREFERQWPAYLSVEVTDPLCREAGELAERYRLRGYDSVHLASYAEVARQAGAGETRFSSFDEKLNRASRSLRRRLVRIR
jgi:uncharacterized protein